MSYWSETEQGEVLDCGDTYYIDCPYCNEESIEHLEVTQMPWGEDNEMRIECPHCKKNFEIRPKYLFKGFFIYSDDEQMEESEVDDHIVDVNKKVDIGFWDKNGEYIEDIQEIKDDEI